MPPHLFAPDGARDERYELRSVRLVDGLVVDVVNELLPVQGTGGLLLTLVPASVAGRYQRVLQ